MNHQNTENTPGSSGIDEPDNDKRQRLEWFMRQQAESLPFIVWTAGPEGEVDYANGRLFELTGISPDSDPATRWQGCLHPEDLPRCVQLWKRCVKEGRDFDIEYRIFSRAENRHRWFRVRAAPIRAPDGSIGMWYGVALDIDQTKRSEAKLREQSKLLDEAQDAILVRDLEKNILYWNKSAERLYGWSESEVLGRSIEESMYVNHAQFQDAFHLTLKSGEWTGELEQTDREGRVLNVEARWTMMRDEAGKPKSILAIHTDNTERKKLEQQFLRAQRMESIGTLAGGIAHDLNNLLSPILMGVDLIRELEPDPLILQILDNIGQSARRGTDLVKQVLSFARGVEGARVLMRVEQLADEVEMIVVNTFPKGIRFQRRISDRLLPVLGDPTQLHQVLLNLCVNARDAMPDGGCLTFSAKNVDLDEQYAVMDRNAVAGRYVSIEISDEGAGMADEVKEHVFEPFFTTKGTGKGTGLGLSTVLGIVRSHGGFVNVYSEQGQGSVFKVYLPASEEVVGMDSQISPLARDSLPRGHGECILVVDDEVSILTITRQTLEAFGYRVMVAEDGAHAISVYAMNRDKIKAVITDMMMPVMDGPALIAALRRLNPHLAVIASSGLNANGSVARAVNAGVKYFLHKPYTADSILRKLNEALHGGERQDQ
ncbi:MAG: PAS domain S-box protein [Verrucomicrobia bacterium]|nr:PAS domain S-box protein [Verrucomicrobiota bacterium]MCH8511039.1 PAS domain S-box protein [Kiritimatiellia bacterium]